VAAISLSEEERAASPHAAFARVRRELLNVQREALLNEHSEGRIDDDVLRKVLRELDLEELTLSQAPSARVG
jgi:CPA1 family monovalent cation:H+ antiporter